MNTIFEWDDEKARINKQKHKVSFETAAYVFDDPFYITVQDRFENGEYRWQTIGKLYNGVVLLVAHTFVYITKRRLSVLFLHVKQQRGRNNAMKIVRYRREDLPKINRKELEELAAMPDEAIDYSDIPPLPDDIVINADRVGYYKPVKKQVTIKLDADILQWLKSSGKGYQTRLNAILRQSMLSALQDSQ